MKAGNKFTIFLMGIITILDAYVCASFLYNLWTANDESYFTSNNMSIFIISCSFYIFAAKFFLSEEWKITRHDIVMYIGNTIVLLSIFVIMEMMCGHSINRTHQIIGIMSIVYVIFGCPLILDGDDEEVEEAEEAEKK